MASNIYEQAIMDANLIKEAAQKAAEKKVLEAIEPRIKEMINKKILSEKSHLDDLESIDDSGADLFSTDETYDFDELVDSMPDVGLDAENSALAQAADVDVAVFTSGDVNIDIEDDDSDEFEFSDVVTESFVKLVSSDFKKDPRIARRVQQLAESVKKLKSIVFVLREGRVGKTQKRRLDSCLSVCAKEALELKGALKYAGRGSQRLEETLISTIKEIREMSRKKTVVDFLFEAKDAESRKNMNEQEDVVDEEEIDLEADMDDDEGMESGVNLSAATSALEDLGAALGLEVDVNEEDEEMEDVELEDKDMDADEDEDADMEEDELDEVYEMAMEDDDLDEVYEIDEAKLRKEVRRMREAAEDEADQFGGAEVMGDVIEIDEETLLNVLADELGSVSESRKRAAARRRNLRRKKVDESTSKSSKLLREYKRAFASQKKQLAEMNLFNAKLVYAVKMLQNKNLSKKQQRHIVEALDNAKTVREAKVLYKSLSESLARKGQSGKNLSESRRILGSSSRSTRSGSPANNGVEMDRWEVLAGISKN